MKTIFMGLNWVGDIVMSLPAIMLASQSSEVHVVTRPHLSAIYRLISDSLIIHPIKTNDWFHKVYKNTQALRQLNADKIIVLPDSLRAAVIAKFCGAKKSFGFSGQFRDLLLGKALNKPDNFKKMHESDLHFMLVQSARLGDSKPQLPHLKPDNDMLLSTMSKLGLESNSRFFILAPGAAFGAAKRWSAKKFAELAVMIQQYYKLPIIVTATEGEKALAEEVCLSSSSKIINAAGKTSLVELVYLMSKAKGLVANDSGTMHLAGITRTPTVIPVGPTDMVRTSPLNSCFEVIQNDMCPIAPCRKRICKKHNHICMENIDAGQIFEALKKLIGKRHE